MADLVFNVAKGKAGYYAGLPGTNDAIIAVPIETSGIVADSVMKDYDDLAAILAGASNEQGDMGRKTLTSVTGTVNDTDDRFDADADDITWTAAIGNPISAVVICYDPDTTSGTDSSIVPLVKLDAAYTPDGSNIVVQFDAAGFYGAV